MVLKNGIRMVYVIVTMTYQQSYGQMAIKSGIEMVNTTGTMTYQQPYGQIAANHGGLMESIFDMKKLLKIKTKHATIYRNSDGKRHRDNDLPAVIDSNGAQIWYRNGLRHRDNDLPAVIHLNRSLLF